MIMDHETIAIIYGSPFINNAIAVTALLCNVATFVVTPRAAKKWFAWSCVIALCLPVYDFASGYIKILHSGGHVAEPFIAAFIWLIFSPTNILIIIGLIALRRLRHIKLWSIIVFISTVASWFGIAALHYMSS